MSQINPEIRSRIEAFATDLTALIQKAALEAVVNALGAPAAPAPKPAARAAAQAAPVKAAAPAKAAAPVKAAVPAKKAAPPPAKKAAVARPKGEKRPPTEIVKTTQRLVDFIKATPGQGIEAIGKALATPTKDLTLPIKKLLSEKQITAQGERRATKYFPG